MDETPKINKRGLLGTVIEGDLHIVEGDNFHFKGTNANDEYMSISTTPVQRVERTRFHVTIFTRNTIYVFEKISYGG